MKKHKTKLKELLVKINSKCTTQIMSDMVRKNMIEYGKDVIEDRALLDYRDGFKPVQRRLLASMCDLRAYAGSMTYKSARITGDCMGKYHPHSDGYGALVTMATSYCPVVFGKGNFGSLTNGPAASRYTEARISKLGMKVIECNAVMETVPNYDGTMEEPVVFPSRLPIYFINGGSGIAVGISCSMPSFNLIEVANALKYVVRKGESATAKGIWKRMPAPDYKYGGRLLSDEKDVIELYKTGVGTLRYSCDYTFEKTDKGGIRCIVTGYCPEFKPNAFLEEMSKQIEKGTVVEAVDTTDKIRGNRLEIECKSYSLFEKFVKKYLEQSVSYRFYALEREKVTDNPEKDIDVEVKSPNLVELMQLWIDWRRVVETKMLKLDLKNTREKLFKEKVRLNASQNIDIIMASVKQDKVEPRDYLVKKLPILIELVKKGKKEKAYEGADFIGEQKIFSLKKTDQNKTKDNIKELKNQIEKIKFDIEHIDDVVIKHLDELTQIKFLDDEKKFSTERKLKIGASQESISVKTKLTDYAICSITSDGKKELLDTNSKKRIEQVKLASTMDRIFYSDCNSKTYSCEPQEFLGKERNWTTAGIAPSDCHRFLFRTNTGKLNIVANEGSDLFTGVKLKNDETIVQMEPLYRGSKLIVKSTTNALKVINSNEYDSCRKNSLGKSSKTGFKNIQTLTVCHKGCKVITRDGKLLEPDEVTKKTKILGIVGDKNFVVLENGKRLYATMEELSNLERIKYTLPLKFSGRKPLQNKE